MLNGSPRKEGCTYTALIQIAGVLEKNGIESEIFQAGTPELENVRAAAEKMKEADALIVGSPVYWASPSGQIIEFMDKFCSLAGKDMLLKPTCCRHCIRKTRRHHSNLGCPLKILFIPPDANRFFQLLEYGTRQHSG